LRNSDPARAFHPALEAEYVRHHLLRYRTLIRVASSLAVLLTLSRAIEQALTGGVSPVLCIQIAFALTVALALNALSWSRRFGSLYLPCAETLVPIRNAIAGAHFAQVAALGQLDLLMTVPLLLISPFFFLGLRYRASLISAVLTTVSYITTAALVHLPTAVAIRSSAYMIVTLLAVAISSRQLERGSRASFLETRLVAELAQLDSLTGAKNRRVFEEHLARIWRQAAEDHRPIAILMIDVDHFKSYNDRYGHLAGDEALRRVAHALQRLVSRPLDILARYGGEEFAVILYDIDGHEAQEIADRMRRAILGLGIEHRSAQHSPVVTVSIGVAAIDPTLQRDARGAVQLADEALYAAKLNGRNRIELMDHTQYQLLSTGVFSSAVA
jgi:diguanylate cyclase (GGDEF)-like protein